MTTLNEQFEKLEETLTRNIANSLIQLHFHQHESAEVLERYYGWDKKSCEKKEKEYSPLTDEDRQGIVDDTLHTLECERIILNFYKKNANIIKETYGTKDPIGDLGLPTKRPAGEDDQQGSISEDARGDDEGGPGPSADSDTGPRHADAESNHGADENEGDAGRTDNGHAQTSDVGSDDRRGEDKTGGTIEILQHQVSWWLDGPGELDESDIEHLTKMITEGYSSGELNHGAEEVRGGWEIKS